MTHTAKGGRMSLIQRKENVRDIMRDPKNVLESLKSQSSNTSKENMSDKIKRLILNDSEKIS